MQGGVPEPAMPNVTTGNKAAVPESANPTTVNTAQSLCAVWGPVHMRWRLQLQNDHELRKL